MAKRFQFRLDPVLRFRTQQEDEEKRKLAEIQGRVSLAKRSLDEIAGAKATEQAAVADLMRASAGISRICDSYRYMVALNMQRIEEEHTLRELEAVAEQRRQEFVEARKKRRALEMLREKRVEEHRYLTDREDQQVMDEIALHRFNRAHRENDR